MMYAMAAASKQWARAKAEVHLTVLVYEEGDWWVALGLENGLATQARSLEEAKEAFREALEQLFIANLERGRWPVMRKAEPEDWDRLEDVELLEPESAGRDDESMVSGVLTFAVAS